MLKLKFRAAANGTRDGKYKGVTLGLDPRITLYTRRFGRNARRPKMKAKLTLIASALLLMSNIAGAQEQKAPSAGAQEQGAPSAKMTGQEAPSAGEQKAPGEKIGQVMKNLGEGMRNLGQSMSMMGQGMHSGGMYRIMFILMDTDGD